MAELIEFETEPCRLGFLRQLDLHKLSVHTLGMQTVVLQPETIAKLIEQPGRPGIGSSSVYVQAQLIGNDERYESGG